MIIRLRIALALVMVSLATIVMGPIQILGLVFDWKIRRRLPGIWHRIACRMIGLKVHTNGTADKRRPLMIAANHSSWLDILVLSAVADVVFVAKAEVKTWPVFSTLARLQATIFVVREERRKTGEQVNEIAERMTAGEIVVLFPEGTTSDGNHMLPIKSSLFGAAASAIPGSADGTVYIQPVSIAYTRVHGMPMGRYHRPIASWPGDTELMPHLTTILKTGSLDAEVTFCESVPFTARSNRKAIAATVQNEIETAFLASINSPR